jgi:hypothetical protein
MGLFNLKKSNTDEDNPNIAKDQDSKEGWVYLTTAENEFEYNIINGLLKESNIVCVGKGKDLDLIDSGFLNIVLGPCIPVDILVPEELYYEASQILNSKISDEEIEKQAICEQEEDRKEDL